jgi:hypothetical protein
MSALSVFRDFLNNALGRTSKPFSEKAVIKKPIIQRVVPNEDETQNTEAK